MPKLTMDDVDKQIEEMLSQPSPVERPDVAGSLLERIRGRGTRPALPRLPKLPRLPRV